MGRYTWIVTCVVLALFMGCASTKHQKPVSSAERKTQGGLHKVAFETARGKINVNLPADLARGDVISGTVIAEPVGKTEEERAKNQDVLNGYVVEIDTQRTRTEDKWDKWIIPALTALPVILRDPDGKEVTRIEVPVLPDPPALELPDFQLPTIGQAGHPIQIPGNFDGDFTSTEIRIGYEFAELLAESPRRAIFESPSDVVGPTTISLEEADHEAEGDFRNISVNLSAPQLTLNRGETTELAVTVEGLEGLDEDIPLQINNETPNIVSMRGDETILISASDVEAGGIYQYTCNLTGITPGGFVISAELPFPPDWMQDGSTPVPAENISRRRETSTLGIHIRSNIGRGETGSIHIPGHDGVVNGRNNTRTELTECQWIVVRATRVVEYNVVTGEVTHEVSPYTWDDFIEGPHCQCILVDNGIFHSKCRHRWLWEPVPTEPCTFAYTTIYNEEGNPRKMYHHNGTAWVVEDEWGEDLVIPVGTYVKAFNGIFRRTRSGWDEEHKRECKYFFIPSREEEQESESVDQLGMPGILWHCTTAEGHLKWVRAEECQWIEIDRQWYHFKDDSLKRPKECDRRFEIRDAVPGRLRQTIDREGEIDIRRLRSNFRQIQLRIWHYDGQRWGEPQEFDLNHVARTASWSNTHYVLSFIKTDEGYFLVLSYDLEVKAKIWIESA